MGYLYSVSVNNAMKYWSRIGKQLVTFRAKLTVPLGAFGMDMDMYVYSISTYVAALDKK